MSAEGVKKSVGYGFVVLAGVADVSENLSEGFLVVDAYEVAVFFKLFLVLVKVVDVFGKIVIVALFVDKAF